MMEKQSLDFIKGYIFSKVEGRVKHAHVNNVERMPAVYVSVPKLWFGLRPIKDKSECLDPITELSLYSSLYSLCQAYNSNQSEYRFHISIEPEEQYIQFTIEAVRISATKEMTIADIEKELGYKIKIVGEHE